MTSATQLTEAEKVELEWESLWERMEASFSKIQQKQVAKLDKILRSLRSAMEAGDASSGSCKSQLEPPKFADNLDFQKLIDVDRAIADKDLMEQHSSGGYEEMDTELEIGVEDCARVSKEIEGATAMVDVESNRESLVEEDDPIVQLRSLKQVSHIRSYIEAFDELNSRAGIEEDQALSLFLSGLVDEIRVPVCLFTPKTLDEAYALSKLQELTLTGVFWCDREESNLRRNEKLDVNSKVEGLNYEFDESSEFADMMETDREVFEGVSSGSDEGGDWLNHDKTKETELGQHITDFSEYNTFSQENKLKEAECVPSVRQIATVKDIVVTLNVASNLTRRPVRFPKPMVKLKFMAKYGEEMGGEGNVRRAPAKAAGEDQIHVGVVEESGWLLNGDYDAFGVDKICEEEKAAAFVLTDWVTLPLVGSVKAHRLSDIGWLVRKWFIKPKVKMKMKEVELEILTATSTQEFGEGIKLVDDASKFLSDKSTRAVAEVLAYLNDSQRTATEDVQVPKQDEKDNRDILILETGTLLCKKNGGRRKEDPLLGDISFDRCFYIDGSVEQLELLASLCNHNVSQGRFYIDGGLEQVEELETLFVKVDHLFCYDFQPKPLWILVRIRFWTKTGPWLQSFLITFHLGCLYFALFLPTMTCFLPSLRTRKLNGGSIDTITIAWLMREDEAYEVCWQSLAKEVETGKSTLRLTHNCLMMIAFDVLMRVLRWIQERSVNCLLEASIRDNGHIRSETEAASERERVWCLKRLSVVQSHYLGSGCSLGSLGQWQEDQEACFRDSLRTRNLKGDGLLRSQIIERRRS